MVFLEHLQAGVLGVMLRVFDKSMIVPASVLAWTALAFGLLPFGTIAQATSSNAYNELRGMSGHHPAGLHVYVQPDPDADGGAGSQPEIVTGPLELDGDSRYYKSGLAVFNGPVRVTEGGIHIGRHVQSVPWLRGREALSDAVNWGWAVFNGPVSISAGDLVAGSAGQAVFHDAVEILHGGIKPQDRVYDRASLTFQGPVVVTGGGIDLYGANSAIFMDQVKMEGGSFRMEDSEGRASVTLGGRGGITAGLLKVIGGNRLVFSLSPLTAADGFIKAGLVVVDADCLIIENHDDALEEGAEIILITAGKIEVNGDNRRIVTSQEDVFELLVAENRISAKLTKRNDSYVWYNTLEFDF